MEGDQASPDFAFRAATPPPPIVSLTPSTSSSRRLSSSFYEPSRPVSSSRRLSWVSLQGRLVGAEEATSAKNIGGGLSKEESLAWELFTPMQRVLIVAIIAVAAADLKKSRQIAKLQRSVEIRDEIMANMQQKLDDLCEQINTTNDTPEIWPEIMFPWYFDENIDMWNFENSRCESRRSSIEFTKENDIFKMRHDSLVGAEQEERRMSDLSDWCSSVTVSAEIQLNAEQDIYNLQKECEEKDAAMKELAAIAKASDAAASKRIAELEDVIKRKNSIITKLKKDMMVLEQKVLQLTRLRRPSYSSSNVSDMKIPAMATNVLFDMDSSTSPSSSDSDAPANPGGHRSKVVASRKPDAPDSNKEPSIVPQDDSIETRNCRHAGKPPASSSVSGHVNMGNPKQRAMSPLKEKTMNQSVDRPLLSRPKQAVPGTGDPKKQRRRVASNTKDTNPMKRWQ
ncbi:hypothetical protein H6P81_010648 [Aristolochia fimbriata]|uniref:Uncharacterized protein n=1 Tax=Aristolochia fimbriata TaxID=158543 RepID=A0AAV7EPD3_ARIFI|nr:hypothetical protein H6P81_010648 [Aristolochia fimbriata]